MRDINLKATEHFEAVARLGSVTRAAEELGVTPSAVSQQLRQLEHQFGVKLFKREKRKLVLTLDGDRLFQTTTHAFGALRNARDSILRQRDMRTLALRVSPSFGVRWLGPRIADFASQNPDWNIRIDATPDFTAFDTEAMDLDVRYGLGGWDGLHVSCVMQDLVLPMCSREYLERLHSVSDDPVRQLANARLIDSAKTLYRWDVWLAEHGIDLPDPAYPFRFDRSSMAIEMAKQGGGVALDSACLCLPELQSGALVPFAPALGVTAFDAYWIVCPERNLNRRIVRRFSEWVEAQCAAHQAQVRDMLTAQGCQIGPPDDSTST